MQRLAFLTVLAIIFVSCSSSELTADDIIDMNTEARGGAEKIRSLQSVVFEGTGSNKGRAFKIKAYYDHNKAMKTEFIVDSGIAYNIISTAGGWNYIPYSKEGAVKLTDAKLKDALFMLDIQLPYFEYKQKGYKAIYEGKDTAHNEQCDKIVLKKEGEGDKVFLFDPKHLLLKTIVYRLTDEGRYISGVNYYFDYRKNADGYLFSYRRSSNETGNQIFYNTITTNIAIGDEVFKPGNK